MLAHCHHHHSRSCLTSNYNTRSLSDFISFNQPRTSTDFFSSLSSSLVFCSVSSSSVGVGFTAVWLRLNQSSNAKVTGCLSSLLERALARSHFSQPGHWGDKKLTNYTCWDEESCTLKQNLASKIEIWKHLIFKCNINSPQISLTNYHLLAKYPSSCPQHKSVRLWSKLLSETALPLSTPSKGNARCIGISSSQSL